MNKDSALYQSVRGLYFGLKNLPNNTKFAMNTHSIKKFKDINKGETCFIIGNGPSMTVQDLDMIYKLGVKSFACNKIYLIFPKTEWRPDYFFSSDDKIVKDIHDTGISPDRCFYPLKYKSTIKKGNFYNSLEFNWKQEGKFSYDMHRGLYGAGTVTSEMIQAAYYMGFTKVYIIGVDFSYNMKNVDSKNQTFQSTGNNYFIKGYASEGQTLNLSSEEAMILGYQAARNAFESNNREIYNATRGGKLEVFERKNLDEVFNSLKNH